MRNTCPNATAPVSESQLQPAPPHLAGFHVERLCCWGGVNSSRSDINDSSRWQTHIDATEGETEWKWQQKKNPLKGRWAAGNVVDVRAPREWRMRSKNTYRWMERVGGPVILDLQSCHEMPQKKKKVSRSQNNNAIGVTNETQYNNVALYMYLKRNTQWSSWSFFIIGWFLNQREEKLAKWKRERCLLYAGQLVTERQRAAPRQ